MRTSLSDLLNAIVVGTGHGLKEDGGAKSTQGFGVWSFCGRILAVTSFLGTFEVTDLALDEMVGRRIGWDGGGKIVRVCAS